MSCGRTDGGCDRVMDAPAPSDDEREALAAHIANEVCTANYGPGWESDPDGYPFSRGVLAGVSATLDATTSRQGAVSVSREQVAAARKATNLMNSGYTHPGWPEKFLAALGIEVSD